MRTLFFIVVSELNPESIQGYLIEIQFPKQMSLVQGSIDGSVRTCLDSKLHSLHGFRFPNMNWLTDSKVPTRELVSIN